MRLSQIVGDSLVLLEATARQLDAVKPLAVRVLDRDAAEQQQGTGDVEADPSEWPGWTDDWYWETGRGQ